MPLATILSCTGAPTNQQCQAGNDLPNESFDVFSNALRLLPEQIVARRHFFEQINEPEEGISNLEAAYSNALNATHGIMCALKDAGACGLIYEDDAVTAVLCSRHVLRHHSGRIKNNTEAARTIIAKHGHLIAAAGSESGVYLHHLALIISPADPRD